MRTAFAGLVVCVLAGCTIGDGSGTGSSSSSSGATSSSGGATTSGIPEVDGLFGTLGKATGDKLAGVWSSTQTSESGEAEVRFRFAEGKLIAGVKCTYPSRGNASLVAGAATTLTTTDLASAAGQFRIGATLTFRKTSGDLDCQGRFDNLSYTFVIQGMSMQLGATEAGSTAALVKVGD